MVGLWLMVKEEFHMAIRWGSGDIRTACSGNPTPCPASASSDRITTVWHTCCILQCSSVPPADTGIGSNGASLSVCLQNPPAHVGTVALSVPKSYIWACLWGSRLPAGRQKSESVGECVYFVLWSTEAAAAPCLVPAGASQPHGGGAHSRLSSSRAGRGAGRGEQFTHWTGMSEIWTSIERIQWNKAGLELNNNHTR